MSDVSITLSKEEYSCIYSSLTFEYSRLSSAIERGRLSAKESADAQHIASICNNLLSRLEELSYFSDSSPSKCK